MDGVSGFRPLRRTSPWVIFVFSLWESLEIFPVDIQHKGGALFLLNNNRSDGWARTSRMFCRGRWT